MKKDLVLILITMFWFQIGNGDSWALELKSIAFENGKSIPASYTCTDEDRSPPLSWENLPVGTESLVLICDDPDAPVGNWVHWVLYNIPPGAKGLPDSLPHRGTLPDRSLQGLNDFKKIGYGGPCPPPGAPHRYFFKLYALDKRLDVGAGLKKMDVLRAMEGHVIEKAVLMGTFRR